MKFKLLISYHILFLLQARAALAAEKGNENEKTPAETANESGNQPAAGKSHKQPAHEPAMQSSKYGLITAQNKDFKDVAQAKEECGKGQTIDAELQADEKQPGKKRKKKSKKIEEASTDAQHMESANNSLSSCFKKKKKTSKDNKKSSEVKDKDQCVSADVCHAEARDAQLSKKSKKRTKSSLSAEHGSSDKCVAGKKRKTIK